MEMNLILKFLFTEFTRLPGYLFSEKFLLFGDALNIL
jgi:hypothetical protein